MTLRAALIGCGKIGSEFADDPLLLGDVYTHAEAYVRCPDTQLVAVCDSDPQRAAKCAERWGAPAHYSRAVDLLHEVSPDIVSICTPDETHFELARLAMQTSSVRALLCEKPLATSVQQGEELVRLANDRDVTIAVAHIRRYAENLRAVQRLLQNGEIGAVRAVTGWYGKGLLHNGSHWFDLLRMLAGEVEWVEAVDRLGEYGDDPSLDVTIGMGSGATAALRAASSLAFSLFELDLLAERGRVQIREAGHAVTVYRAGPSRRYSGYRELIPDDRDLGDMRNLMLHAVEDLVRALSDGREPLCSASDGLAALRIAEAARKAAATGARVRISPSASAGEGALVE